MTDQEFDNARLLEVIENIEDCAHDIKAMGGFGHIVSNLEEIADSLRDEIEETEE